MKPIYDVKKKVAHGPEYVCAIQKLTHFLYKVGIPSKKLKQTSMAMAHNVYFGFIAVKLLVKVVGPIMRLRI